MNTWIFQGNPNDFNIDQYLQRTEDIHFWSVRYPKYQNKLKIGDAIYFWRSKGSKNNISGIIALGIVSEECKPRPEYSDIKVGINLQEIRLQPQNGMITLELIKSDPILSQMQLIKVRVGVNFLLNEKESALIQQYWNILNLNNYDDNDEDFKSPEGRIKLRTHKIRERNPKIKEKAIELFLKQNNSLYCEVCRFSFEDKYGKIGKGFIEAHHLKPISKYKENEITYIKNVKLVCSNCHRIIHKGDPLEMFYQLQKIFINK